MHILLADDHVLFSDALHQYIRVLKPDWMMDMVENLGDAILHIEKNHGRYDSHFWLLKSRLERRNPILNFL